MVHHRIYPPFSMVLDKKWAWRVLKSILADGALFLINNYGHETLWQAPGRLSRQPVGIIRRWVAKACYWVIAP
jgi:hypothetical protein